MAGLPSNLNPRAPLSAALTTTVGGPGSLWGEVDLMGDWNGREDLIADHARRIVDLLPTFTNPGQVLTRTAVSEHTFANGFTENVFYYGDSWGNVDVGVDTSGDGLVDDTLTLNLPTILNAFGTLNSDNRIVITGIAVNPVADLGSFSDVPAASPFCPWVQDFAARGITAGCGAGLFCPTATTNRGEVSVFLTKTFSLKLYQP